MSAATVLLTALALGTGLATLALARAVLRTGADLLELRTTLFRVGVIRTETVRLQRAGQQIADVQRLTEGMVAGGTEGVRAIHRGIAAIPFGVLEAIPATRDVTRVVRVSHDLIADAVYDTIGAVNRGVGAGLRSALKAGDGAAPAVEKQGDDPSPPPDPERPALK